MDVRGDDEPVFVYDELHAVVPNNVTHIRVDPSDSRGCVLKHNYLLEVELPEGLTKIEDNAYLIGGECFKH